MKSFLLALFLGVVSSKIVTERFKYTLDDGMITQEYDGFVAFDDQIQNLPGLVLEHQFFGEGANEDYWAIFWAQQGFFAFAADIYGKGVRPDNPIDAAANLTFLESNPMLFRSRLTQTFELMFSEFPNTDRKKGGAAIGFCLGGDSVFELARAQLDVPIPDRPSALRAIFAFHPAKAGVLGTIGIGLNNNIPMDVWVQSHKGTLDMVSTNIDALQLQANLDMQGVKHWQTVVYGDNVDHGFSLPFEDAYDQNAADQGMRSVAFVLNKVFPGTFSPFMYGKMDLVPPTNPERTWAGWADLEHYQMGNTQ